MDIGKNIQQSIDLYLKNFVVLFLAGLVVAVLSTFTIGILAGPMIAGFLVLCFKLLRGEKGDFNDIFSQFNKFVPTFLLVLMMAVVWIVMMIIGFIPVLGILCQIAVGPALFVIFIIAMALLVEKNLQPLDALKQGLNYFLTNPLMIWLYSLIICILAGLGAVLGSILGAIFMFIPLIGFLFSMLFIMAGTALTSPFCFIGMAIGYQELSQKEATPVIKLEKQTLQIAGISLAVLLVIGLVCFFTIGRRAYFPATGPFGMSPFGRNSVDKNEITKVKIGGKTLSVGANLPNDYPRDIPIYPNGKMGGFIGGSDGKVVGSTCTLSTKDSADQVTGYYVKALEGQGWTVTKAELGNMKMLSMEKDDRKGGVTVNPRDNNTTDILISITE